MNQSSNSTATFTTFTTTRIPTIVFRPQTNLAQGQRPVAYDFFKRQIFLRQPPQPVFKHAPLFVRGKFKMKIKTFTFRFQGDGGGGKFVVPVPDIVRKHFRLARRRQFSWIDGRSNELISTHGVFPCGCLSTPRKHRENTKKTPGIEIVSGDMCISKNQHPHQKNQYIQSTTLHS